MEVSVVTSENVPEGCLLSISAGGSRRQAPLLPRQKFAFSGQSAAACVASGGSGLKVDVLSVQGTSRIPARELATTFIHEESGSGSAGPGPKTFQVDIKPSEKGHKKADSKNGDRSGEGTERSVERSESESGQTQSSSAWSGPMSVSLNIRPTHSGSDSSRVAASTMASARRGEPEEQETLSMAASVVPPGPSITEPPAPKHKEKKKDIKEEGATPPRSSRRHHAALEARSYLEDHNILPFVERMLRTLVQERPNDPWHCIRDMLPDIELPPTPTKPKGMEPVDIESLDEGTAIVTTPQPDIWKCRPSVGTWLLQRRPQGNPVIIVAAAAMPLPSPEPAVVTVAAMVEVDSAPDSTLAPIMVVAAAPLLPSWSCFPSIGTWITLRGLHHRPALLPEPVISTPGPIVEEVKEEAEAEPASPIHSEPASEEKAPASGVAVADAIVFEEEVAPKVAKELVVDSITQVRGDISSSGGDVDRDSKAPSPEGPPTPKEALPAPVEAEARPAPPDMRKAQPAFWAGLYTSFPPVEVKSPEPAAPALPEVEKAAEEAAPVTEAKAEPEPPAPPAMEKVAEEAEPATEAKAEPEPPAPPAMQKFEEEVISITEAKAEPEPPAPPEVEKVEEEVISVTEAKAAPEPPAPPEVAKVVEVVEPEADAAEALQVVAVVDFAFMNLQYDKVTASPVLELSLKRQVGEAIGSTVHVPPSCVDVNLASGSVLVNAAIRQPNGDAAEVIKKQIESDGDSLLQNIANYVALIPGIMDALAPGADGLGVAGLKTSVEQRKSGASVQESAYMTMSTAYPDSDASLMETGTAREFSMETQQMTAKSQAPPIEEAVEEEVPKPTAETQVLEVPEARPQSSGDFRSMKAETWTNFYTTFSKLPEPIAETEVMDPAALLELALDPSKAVDLAMELPVEAEAVPEAPAVKSWTGDTSGDFRAVQASYWAQLHSCFATREPAPSPVEAEAAERPPTQERVVAAYLLTACIPKLILKDVSSSQATTPMMSAVGHSALGTARGNGMAPGVAQGVAVADPIEVIEKASEKMEKESLVDDVASRSASHASGVASSGAISDAANAAVMASILDAQDKLDASSAGGSQAESLDGVRAVSTSSGLSAHEIAVMQMRRMTPQGSSGSATHVSQQPSECALDDKAFAAIAKSLIEAQDKVDDASSAAFSVGQNETLDDAAKTVILESVMNAQDKVESEPVVSQVETVEITVTPAPLPQLQPEPSAASATAVTQTASICALDDTANAVVEQSVTNAQDMLVVPSQPMSSVAVSSKPADEVQVAAVAQAVLQEQEDVASEVQETQATAVAEPVELARGTSVVSSGMPTTVTAVQETLEVAPGTSAASSAMPTAVSEGPVEMPVPEAESRDFSSIAADSQSATSGLAVPVEVVRRSSKASTALQSAASAGFAPILEDEISVPVSGRTSAMGTLVSDEVDVKPITVPGDLTSVEASSMGPSCPSSVAGGGILETEIAGAADAAIAAMIAAEKEEARKAEELQALRAQQEATRKEEELAAQRAKEEAATKAAELAALQAQREKDEVAALKAKEEADKKAEEIRQLQASKDFEDAEQKNVLLAALAAEQEEAEKEAKKLAAEQESMKAAELAAVQAQEEAAQKEQELAALHAQQEKVRMAEEAAAEEAAKQAEAAALEAKAKEAQRARPLSGMSSEGAVEQVSSCASQALDDIADSIVDMTLAGAEEYVVKESEAAEAKSSHSSGTKPDEVAPEMATKIVVDSISQAEGDMSTSETEVERLTQARGVAVADAIDMTELEPSAPTMVAASVNFKFDNLDYNKVMKTGDLAEKLKSKTVDSIAEFAKVSPSSVDVQLSPGSVVVNAQIYCAHADAADQMQKQMDANRDSFLAHMDKHVSQIPGINDAVEDGKFGLGLGQNATQEAARPPLPPAVPKVQLAQATKEASAKKAKPPSPLANNLSKPSTPEVGENPRSVRSTVTTPSSERSGIAARVIDGTISQVEADLNSEVNVGRFSAASTDPVMAVPPMAAEAPTPDESVVSSVVPPSFASAVVKNAICEVEVDLSCSDAPVDRASIFDEGSTEGRAPSKDKPFTPPVLTPPVQKQTQSESIVSSEVAPELASTLVKDSLYQVDIDMAESDADVDRATKVSLSEAPTIIAPIGTAVADPVDMKETEVQETEALPKQILEARGSLDEVRSTVSSACPPSFASGVVRNVVSEVEVDLANSDVVVDRVSEFEVEERVQAPPEPAPVKAESIASSGVPSHVGRDLVRDVVKNVDRDVSETDGEVERDDVSAVDPSQVAKPPSMPPKAASEASMNSNGTDKANAVSSAMVENVVAQAALDAGEAQVDRASAVSSGVPKSFASGVVNSTFFQVKMDLSPRSSSLIIDRDSQVSAEAPVEEAPPAPEPGVKVADAIDIATVTAKEAPPAPPPVGVKVADAIDMETVPDTAKEVPAPVEEASTKESSGWATSPNAAGLTDSDEVVVVATVDFIFDNADYDKITSNSDFCAPLKQQFSEGIAHQARVPVACVNVDFSAGSLVVAASIFCDQESVAESIKGGIDKNMEGFCKAMDLRAAMVPDIATTSTDGNALKARALGSAVKRIQVPKGKSRMATASTVAPDPADVALEAFMVDALPKCLQEHRDMSCLGTSPMPSATNSCLPSARGEIPQIRFVEPIFSTPTTDIMSIGSPDAGSSARVLSTVMMPRNASRDTTDVGSNVPAEVMQMPPPAAAPKAPSTAAMQSEASEAPPSITLIDETLDVCPAEMSEDSSMVQSRASSVIASVLGVSVDHCAKMAMAEVEASQETAASDIRTVVSLNLAAVQNAQLQAGDQTAATSPTASHASSLHEGAVVAEAAVEATAGAAAEQMAEQATEVSGTAVADAIQVERSVASGVPTAASFMPATIPEDTAVVQASARTSAMNTMVSADEATPEFTSPTAAKSDITDPMASRASSMAGEAGATVSAATSGALAALDVEAARKAEQERQEAAAAEQEKLDTARAAAQLAVAQTTQEAQKNAEEMPHTPSTPGDFREMPSTGWSAIHSGFASQSEVLFNTMDANQDGMISARGFAKALEEGILAPGPNAPPEAEMAPAAGVTVADAIDVEEVPPAESSEKPEEPADLKDGMVFPTADFHFKFDNMDYDLLLADKDTFTGMSQAMQGTIAKYAEAPLTSVDVDLYSGSVAVTARVFCPAPEVAQQITDKVDTDHDTLQELLNQAAWNVPGISAMMGGILDLGLNALSAVKGAIKMPSSEGFGNRLTTASTALPYDSTMAASTSSWPTAYSAATKEQFRDTREEWNAADNSEELGRADVSILTEASEKTILPDAPSDEAPTPPPAVEEKPAVEEETVEEEKAAPPPVEERKPVVEEETVEEEKAAPPPVEAAKPVVEEETVEEDKAPPPPAAEKPEIAQTVRSAPPDEEAAGTGVADAIEMATTREEIAEESVKEVVAEPIVRAPFSRMASVGTWSLQRPPAAIGFAVAAAKAKIAEEAKLAEEATAAAAAAEEATIPATLATPKADTTLGDSADTTMVLESPGNTETSTSTAVESSDAPAAGEASTNLEESLSTAPSAAVTSVFGSTVVSQPEVQKRWERPSSPVWISHPPLEVREQPRVTWNLMPSTASWLGRPIRPGGGTRTPPVADSAAPTSPVQTASTEAPASEKPESMMAETLYPGASQGRFTDTDTTEVPSKIQNITLSPEEIAAQQDPEKPWERPSEDAKNYLENPPLEVQGPLDGEWSLRPGTGGTWCASGALDATIDSGLVIMGTPWKLLPSSGTNHHKLLKNDKRAAPPAPLSEQQMDELIQGPLPLKLQKVREEVEKLETECKKATASNNNIKSENELLRAELLRLKDLSSPGDTPLDSTPLASTR